MSSRRIGREEYDGKRWIQLKRELDRVREEGGPENEELEHDLEGLVNKIYRREKDMSITRNEQLEELGKILFALIDHLGLTVVCNEKKDMCKDNHCMKPDCIHEKKWTVKPKSKEYKKNVSKLDDLIMTGEDEE